MSTSATAAGWSEQQIAQFRSLLQPAGWQVDATGRYLYGAPAAGNRLLGVATVELEPVDPVRLDEAAQTAKAVASAVSVPVIVWGCANPDKDAEVLRKVAETCAGMNIIIGPVVEANHKQLGAQALAYNLTIITNTLTADTLYFTDPDWTTLQDASLDNLRKRFEAVKRQVEEVLRLIAGNSGAG